MIDHTDRATCEVCGNSGEMILASNNILMCIDCDIKDIRPRTVEEINNRAIAVQHRFREIDSRLTIATDIFNAETISIHAAKKAIDEDSAIPADKKHFELAKLVESRYDKLSDIIFSRRQEITEAESKQRALQTYYNELGKRLRQEEREAIRLKDATYKPLEPKVIKQPKAPTVKKVNVNEIKDACAQAGIPAAMPVIMMLMTAKKIGVAEAINSFKEAKAKQVK